MDKQKFWRELKHSFKWGYTSFAIGCVVMFVIFSIVPSTGPIVRTNVISLVYFVPKVLLFTRVDASQEAAKLTEGAEDALQKAEILQEWIKNNTVPFYAPEYDKEKHFVDLWPLLDGKNCSREVSSSRRCIVRNSSGDKIFDCYRKFAEQKYNSWMFDTRCGSCGEVNSLFAFMLGSTGVTSRVVEHRGANHMTAEFYYNGSWVPVDVWWSHNSSDNTLRYVGFEKQDFDRNGMIRYSMEATYPNETTEDVTKDYALNYGSLNVICKSKKILELLSPINITITSKKCTTKEGLNILLNSGETGINYTLSIDSEKNMSITILPDVVKELILD